jgi:hypothetical protein
MLLVIGSEKSVDYIKIAEFKLSHYSIIPVFQYSNSFVFEDEWIRN